MDICGDWIVGAHLAESYLHSNSIILKRILASGKNIYNAPIFFFLI